MMYHPARNERQQPQFEYDREEDDLDDDDDDVVVVVLDNYERYDDASV